MTYHHRHLYLKSDCRVLHTHLIYLIPDRVEILVDHITLKCHISHTDLGIWVTLALHQAAHLVIFGNQILGLQQDDSQHPLQEGIISLYIGSFFYYYAMYLLL